ncbi:helix-turn-helix domain-containing protein [Miltoncostaea oceani]|uniref:helix-turn-helix domain-containing protein n=1 Tax=Miltoncostaea oceani TaxID=2843216 RepID=UPI001C3E84A7|nr:helix-turn-helix transcriptional regulator [Miltoncostaea oceani]
MSDYLEPSKALGTTVWMRRARELGLSREDLAGLLGWSLADGGRSLSGWSPKTIARIERGERGIRSVAELQLLAPVLDLTPGQFEARVSQAASAIREEGSLGLPEAIAAIADPQLREVLWRIADDLTSLALRLSAESASEVPPPTPSSSNGKATR